MDSLRGFGTFIHDYSACCERAFDVLGYLPFVSKISGALRLKLATIQLILAVSLGVFYLIAQVYRKFNASTIFVNLVEQQAMALIQSSVKNAVRGAVETLFFMHFILIVFDYIKTQELQFLSKTPSPSLDWPLLYQVFPPDKRQTQVHSCREGNSFT